MGEVECGVQGSVGYECCNRKEEEFVKGAWHEEA